MSKGQVLVVLEAMKMEYPINAPVAGQVGLISSARKLSSTSKLVVSKFICSPKKASHRTIRAGHNVKSEP